MKLTEEQKQEYRNQGLSEQEIAALDSGGDSSAEVPPLPFDASTMAALNEANRLRQDAERRAAEAENRAREIERQRMQNNTTRLEQGEVFNDPEKFRSVINQDMAAQIAPLNDFMRGVQREREYYAIKNRVRITNPKIALILQQGAEPIVDQIFLNESSLQINEQTFINQVMLILGNLAFNNIGNQTPPNNPPPNNPPSNRQSNANTDMLPPHMRPSNRGTGDINKDKVEPELTENERRIAREKGLTPGEYVKMRDCEPHQMEEVWKDINAKRKSGARY